MTYTDVQRKEIEKLVHLYHDYWVTYGLKDSLPTDRARALRYRGDQLITAQDAVGINLIDPGEVDAHVIMATRIVLE